MVNLRRVWIDMEKVGKAILIMRVKLDPQRRLVVPAQICEEAGLSPGEELEMRLVSDSVTKTFLLVVSPVKEE